MSEQVAGSWFLLKIEGGGYPRRRAAGGGSRGAARMSAMRGGKAK